MNQQQQENDNHSMDLPPHDVDEVEEEDVSQEEPPKGGEEEKEGKGGENHNEKEEEDSVASNSPLFAPPELQMSALEEGWVWNLMKWMEQDDPNHMVKNNQSGGKVPSDFEYAVNAIVSKGNKERADQRIRAMQHVRQKYNIQDTVQEGMTVFQHFIDVQPGTFLHADSRGSEGILLVFDHGKFFPTRFTTASSSSSSSNVNHVTKFVYYLCQICSPNFDVLRGGIQISAETTGMSYRNMDIGSGQHIFQELFAHAPLKWNGFCFYNTNQLISSFLDLMKQFMPEEIRDATAVGCRLEVDQINDPTGSSLLNRILNAALLRPNPIRLTLPEVFLQPDYEVAMQNLMTKVRSLLDERYRNEETFELFSRAPPPTPTPTPPSSS